MSDPDREARALGGYETAAALHDDIADQFTGLGDPYFDALAASHRTTATLLRQRAKESNANARHA